MSETNTSRTPQPRSKRRGWLLKFVKYRQLLNLIDNWPTLHLLYNKWLMGIANKTPLNERMSLGAIKCNIDKGMIHMPTRIIIDLVITLVSLMKEITSQFHKHNLIIHVVSINKINRNTSNLVKNLKLQVLVCL